MTTETESPGTHEMKDVGQPVCEDCQGPILVWFAPNALWNRVKGGVDATDDPGGVLCPNCFIRRAEAEGVVPTAWIIDTETLDVEGNEPVRLIDKAINCAAWPIWLSGIVDRTNQAADAADMSTEQAVAYGVLSALSIPVAAQDVAVGEALVWAMDEIDALSNRAHGFAYPQGMRFNRRQDQAANYERAVLARRSITSPPSVPTTIDDAMASVPRELVETAIDLLRLYAYNPDWAELAEKIEAALGPR